MTNPRKLIHFLAVSGLLAVFILSAPLLASAQSSSSLDSSTQFYVPKPNHGALEQIADLTASGNKGDANLIKEMIKTPQAVWFTKGTPKTVKQDVRNTVLRAADKGQVPVLVAYNIPGRDCANLSAGGAMNTAEYKAWIDAFANGIGNGKAIVIIEPDGLGLLPGSNCGGPRADYPFTDAQRYEEINYAVDALKAQPNTLVYLDATHSAWQAVGDAARRLVLGGVQHADGFFLNVSNYQFTANNVAYGTWLSSCIAYATTMVPGDFGGCPNQYWDGGPATNWDGDALDRYQVWQDVRPFSGVHDDLKWNIAGINSRYTDVLGATPTTHFVIDTSRNGVGPWNYGSSYPNDGVAQDWCNPPGRGLGPRPTANTGNSLVDAYLWIKLPGESDGQCTRGTAGPEDPERGVVDPVAGQWFPEMALELVHNANPSLP